MIRARSRGTFKFLALLTASSILGASTVLVPVSKSTSVSENFLGGSAICQKQLLQGEAIMPYFSSEISEQGQGFYDHKL
jgi:hypothetical protein